MQYMGNTYERRNVGGASIRSRNGAPSRKGCVVNGEMTNSYKASNNVNPRPYVRAPFGKPYAPFRRQQASSNPLITSAYKSIYPSYTLPPTPRDGVLSCHVCLYVVPMSADLRLYGVRLSPI